MDPARKHRGIGDGHHHVLDSTYPRDEEAEAQLHHVPVKELETSDRMTPRDIPTDLKAPVLEPWM